LALREKDLLRREAVLDMRQKIYKLEENYCGSTSSSEDSNSPFFHFSDLRITTFAGELGSQKSTDVDTLSAHSMLSSGYSPFSSSKKSKSPLGPKALEEFKLDENDLRSSQSIQSKAKGLFKIESSYEREKKKDSTTLSSPGSDDRKGRQSTIKSKLMVSEIVSTLRFFS
jgi:hypothetical protein